MSMQTLNWPTCTSHMELRTVTGAPLCVYMRNVSREAHVPQSLSRSMWFQHDGAPLYYTNDVRQHQTLHLESIGYVVVVRSSGLLDSRTCHA
ncbi:hypothetical protein AVEN_45431-1 [Araneus ventricosus]|uniref:Uncharacterized protein n=1 Tax=Araneus ventricosus TaxID=182803 RepID=A0A4Y2S573_ARAVE|nr:hypothetical protein AVEN_45431-1 [Araneus ventricosus]